MKDDLERETSVDTSPKFQPKFQALSFSCETTLRRRILKSTLHPTIFWEMVKFVALGVLYFSLVLPL